MKQMKRVFLFVLLLSAVGLGAFAQETAPVSLNEAIRNAMQYLTGRIAPNSKVVVLNFSAPTEALSSYIIEDLSDYIVNSRTLTVVDRRSLEAIRGELNFNMSGEVSDATAQRIGEMLGAQSIISGSIAPLGRDYRFRVQAIEVETAALQGGQTLTVTEDDTLAALLGRGTGFRLPSRQGTPSRQVVTYGDQRFALGGQVGTLYGFGPSGNYDESWNGNFGLLGSIYGVYAFNATFRLQFGLNYVVNDLYDVFRRNFSYTSLDIPLLPSLYFSPSSNFLFRISIGPYLSLIVGEVELVQYGDYYDNYYTLPSPNLMGFGLLGGIGAGYKIGNGNIVFDIRYLTDFTEFAGDTGSWVRRGITAVLGYEHWF